MLVNAADHGASAQNPCNAAAIEAAATAAGEGTVYLPAGRYNLKRPINLGNARNLVGQFPTELETHLNYNGDNTYLPLITGNRLSIHGIYLWCNNNCPGIKIQNGWWREYNDIYIRQNTGVALLIDASWGSNLSNITVDSREPGIRRGPAILLGQHNGGVLERVVINYECRCPVIFTTGSCGTYRNLMLEHVHAPGHPLILVHEGTAKVIYDVRTEGGLPKGKLREVKCKSIVELRKCNTCKVASISPGLAGGSPEFPDDAARAEAIVDLYDSQNCHIELIDGYGNYQNRYADGERAVVRIAADCENITTAHIVAALNAADKTEYHVTPVLYK
jgi:hypothetical protein